MRSLIYFLALFAALVLFDEWQADPWLKALVAAVGIGAPLTAFIVYISRRG